MNAQTGGCTQPHARAESFQRISYTISFPSVSIGILEIHTSVTICGPCRSACPAAPSIWGSPTAYPQQNRRPASMERPRRQNRGSRLRPPGPAFGQVVLVVVALAPVRQHPVQGAVRVHMVGPHSEHKGRCLAVAVLLKADGPVVVELDDLQRTGFLLPSRPRVGR